MIDLGSPSPAASALSALLFLALIGMLLALGSLITGKKSKQDGTGFFERLVAALRWLDRALVQTFSWIIGTRYRKKYFRVPMVMLYFLGLTAASVWVPWPYSMGFIGGGVFSIFVVFRHWSRDEDEAVAALPFERKDIKIDGTLGVEVLIAVGFLFVFAPTAFAQLQAQGLGFELEAKAGPFTFLIYTLIETVKAGSLVDYYDLYADRIGLDRLGVPREPSNWAKATILGYRISLNLLLLAAIKRLFDIAKRRSEGADLRSAAEALRSGKSALQTEAVARLKDFALQGRGNARDMLEMVAEPHQSEHLPIQAEIRFAAADALLDYGTQRGGASALYAAADGYRALLRSGFDRVEQPARWRAAAHNLGNTLVQLGQQLGDPERLKEAADIYDQLVTNAESATSEKSHLNALIVRANVLADLAMMTGERPDLEHAAAQYKRALEVADPAQNQSQIALLNVNLGATLVDLAEHSSDLTLIQEAIANYRSALETLSPEQEAETWSMAQNNLGNALADYGHWTGDATQLEAGITAHFEALKVRTKGQAPLLWSMSQTNLANALTRLAKLQQDPERLRAAIDHYQSAQSVTQRETFPRDWAWSEASLASAHIDLGQMTHDEAAFEKALTYCQGAIAGYGSAKMPAKQAWAQGLKGNALVGLERYADAIQAFKAALTWQTYDNSGQDWVLSTNNLAACHHQLGHTDTAIQLLQDALKIAPVEARIAATLQTLSGESVPDQQTSDPSTEPDSSAEDRRQTVSEPIRVKFIAWRLESWNEGRFVNSLTADWKLEINGALFQWRVTEAEYLEEDGQGKGSGYEILDLQENSKTLYRTLWDHWMNDQYDPTQVRDVEEADWRIGTQSGADVFWAIYHHLYDQGIELFSRWEAEEPGFEDQILALDAFTLSLIADSSESEGEAVEEQSPATETRHYHVSVQRICGEFVMGHVSPEFYAYWKDRDDFETQVLSLGDPDEFDSDSPSPYPDGRECEGWYAIDDIAHVNNAVFDGNVIYVDEVVADEDAYMGFSSLREGYTEEFDIDEVFHDMPEGFAKVTQMHFVDTEIEAPEAPVFVAKSIEKGAQTDVYITTQGAFDLTKLQFEIWNMDGDRVIASIHYDGVEQEIIADSSMGRAFYAYLGALD